MLPKLLLSNELLTPLSVKLKQRKADWPNVHTQGLTLHHPKHELAQQMVSHQIDQKLADGTY